MPKEVEFNGFCAKFGIAVAARALGIGRELKYLKGPARTIVVRFRADEFPGKVIAILKKLLALQPNWLLLNRYGPFQATHITSTTLEAPIEALVGSEPSLSGHDDKYFLAENGGAILAYDHNLLPEGMPLFIAESASANPVLCALNEAGAEFEVYSNDG